MDDIQSWWEVPSIAHFCSLFRAAFNLLDFDIEELEEALLTDGAEDSGSSLLQELIVRLLCGCLGNNDISTFNYQMFLRRLFRRKCQEYGRDNPFNTDIDFQFLPLRTKVEILHALCDFRLDAEDVQDLLKNLESDSLRVEPLGHDENHSAYWYFYGTRLYREDYPKVKKKVKEKRHRGKEEKRHKKRGKTPPPDSESDEKGAGIWQVVCFTEQDWDKITDSFRDSTSKNERALFHTLAEDFLPEIPRLFAEKERLQRKRMLEYQPRRQSSRLEKLKQQKEEEEKMLQREEEERLRQEREKKERLQQQEMLKERENRALMVKERVTRALRCSLSRTNSECGSTGSVPDSLTDNRSNRSSTFVGRQTNNSLSSATGQIVIQGLRQKLCSSQVFKQTEEDLQTGMYKILEYIKNHDDAWPFADPVDEDYAPRYYSIIRQPMDLQRMEDKLDEGEYLTFADFKADFQLIVDNCRQYNGIDNEYTEMVGNLQEAFQMAVERYLESDPSSDEEVAVEFPTGTTSSESRIETQGHRHKHHHRARRKKEKSRQSSHINRNIPSPESERTVQSSTAEEREEVIREREQEAKTDHIGEGSMDTEGSSTKDDTVELKRPHSHNSTKRKKKTGVIKNVAEIEALELATEQTLKDINKWLDDTPRFSEFSSASNSPSHLIGAEEYEVVRSRIENEYRHSLKLDRDRPSSGTSSRSNKDGRDIATKRRSIKDSSKQHQQRRREVQRTIERLQPGKSKGNLISNIQSANKTVDEVGGCSGVLGLNSKPKENRNSLLVKTDEATPKLSLGTVLTSDVLGFGVAGHNNHNFDSSEGAHIEDKKPAMLLTGAEGTGASPRDVDIKLSPEKQNQSLPVGSQSPQIKKEDEKTVAKEEKSVSKYSKHEKVTPDLSVWFKAFGAPKTTAMQKQRKPEVSAQQDMDTCTEERRLETVPSPIPTEVPLCSGSADRSQSVGDMGLRPPTQEDLERKADDAPSPTQQSVAPAQRQRKVSTGSSMSERSSFSQDPMDPLDGYPAPYPSPLHRSPMAASPVMASPRPEDTPKPTTSYPPLNGTIRVGFYQDTSSSLQKSSPEKSNSSCSPQSPSPFQQPIYSPRYPPQHDTPGYLTYRNPTPGPPQTYDGLPVPPYSAVMHYYDTSKPLTDQYQAARTQASEEYIPGSLSLSYSSGQQQGYPSPVSPSTSPLPYTSDRQSGFQLSVPQPSSARRSPSVPVTSSGLLGTLQYTNSQQQNYDITVPRPSALHKSAPSAVTSSLPFSTSHQQGYEISIPRPSSMSKTSSASAVTVPSTALPFSSDRHQGYDTTVPRPSTKAPATVFPVKKRLYSDTESATGLQHHHQTASRLHQSPSSPVTTASAITPPPSVGVSQPINLPLHTTGNRLANSALSNPNTGERFDQTSPVNIPQAQHSAMTEQVRMSPVSIPISSPQISVSQASERLLPVSKQQTVSERILANPIAEVDGGQHSDSVLQASEKPHQSMDPHVIDRLYSEEVIQPSERLHRCVTSPIGNHQTSTVSALNIQQPIDISHPPRQVSSKQPSTDQLQKSPTTVRVGNDITFHRGPFSPAAPSSISNLTNLSHIVDRFSSDGSPFYTTGGDKSGIFGQGSVQPPISSAAAAMAMFSQPAPAISYNRSVPELSSVLSSKVSDVQSVYSRTVPELSSVLPGKSAPPITNARPPSYDRTVSELSSYGHQTMDISTSLPNKSTPPVEGQTSYNHSVTDLPSVLTNKVPPTTAINDAVPNYSRSVVVTDFSMVPTKVPPLVEALPLSVSAVTTPTPKPSRKRKTKQQQQVTSGSDTSVSSSSTTAFQQYVSEPSAIALKTVQTSVVPGSAFNFGPATSGLGLYGDPAGFLDEYRSPPTGYYIPPGTDSGHDKQTSAPPAPTPFPFLGHPQPRPPPGYPQLATAFLNHQPALMDASGATTPLYQQYLQRHQEELLRHSAASAPMVLHQGLLASTPGYPPGYHPALGIRQPYDALNRPSWL